MSTVEMIEINEIRYYYPKSPVSSIPRGSKVLRIGKFGDRSKWSIIEFEGKRYQVPTIYCRHAQE